jgi:hypothetical protein
VTTVSLFGDCKIGGGAIGGRLGLIGAATSGRGLI